MPPLNGANVMHVVIDTQQPEYHWLYMRGGEVVKWDPNTRAVVKVSRLPDEKLVQRKSEE